MHPIRIIPCLDIKDAKVVKGKNFVDLKNVGEPLQLAKDYNKQQADELIFLDITATNQNRDTLIDLASSVARELFIPFTIGGGISSVMLAEKIIKAGLIKFLPPPYSALPLPILKRPCLYLLFRHGYKPAKYYYFFSHP